MIAVRDNPYPMHKPERPRTLWARFWNMGGPVLTDEGYLVNMTHLYQPQLWIHRSAVDCPEHPVAELALVADVSNWRVTVLAVCKDGTDRAAHIGWKALTGRGYGIKQFKRGLDAVCPAMEAA